MNLVTVLAGFAASVLLIAQDPSLQSNSPEPAPDPVIEVAPTATPARPATPAEGRIMGVIPNNKTVPNALSVDLREPALTARAKFGLAVKDTFDPYTFVLAGFYAGVAQWQNDFAPFGQGAQGYGKRIGAAYADQAFGNFLTEAIFPALLHEDPRYFRKGTGGAWRRTRYAISRTWITRTDSGRDRFNYSEVLGNAAAAGISNLYYPSSERTLGETGEKLAVQLVSDGVFNVLLEFWPDMRHAILKK